ncbi:polysaccharide deacetylase [Alicyclobacillus cycloheptanicus]|uniref:Peptidoglycan/xylan/chitin deacetylase (PgdA/CDA1 family) n=1 Tax=Alicyclobacillus cycloheptanicus TaxID=1457 RepID=A0ABT9XHW9_9BACL|nr:polysaccharide deacetylase [Alicyclobacillus cycloheptanicus]MDQ0189885.1 peptidoglycan/xylan/chitin deacetylase (PgdA/CDA1 family) [Alicyclobacillus cycloheptanicus]WDM02210.1 polysaccharide deacetylase [Alicyclobacillus cycloheptanicus]
MSHAPTYRWPNGNAVAVSLSFDFDGETPFLWRTRDINRSVIGEMEQRRFGPRVGIYRILDVLKQWHIKATFFVPGLIAERYPEAVEAIVRDQHEIGLHGYVHERVDEIDDGTLDWTIAAAKQKLEDITGRPVCGYRSPSWEMTPAVFAALKRHGLTYDSSLMGYDHPYWMEGVPEVPVQWLLDDAIFYRYVGGGQANPPQRPSHVYRLWEEEYTGLRAYGGLFLLTMHPWISGRASRIAALERLIRRIRSHHDVWWATCQEVADYHSTHYVSQFHETASERLWGGPHG